MSGPLAGIRVVELAGLAPGPFACMVLADLGAFVLRVDRPAPGPGNPAPVPTDALGRGRTSVTADLKSASGAALVRRLASDADVLVEGFRPGVAERLGVGPAQCLALNPRLVYGRLTGWGQTGPLADRVGHDINYLALSGALAPLGRAGQAPAAPLNLLADFGGGGMLLAVGVLAALVERATSGRGQVVDAAMVDGAALLTTFLHGMKAAGAWPGARGENLLDGGAPFYDTYVTSDDRYVAVGALEPAFYAALLDGLALDPADLPDRADPTQWPALRSVFAQAFSARTRAEWVEVFTGTDACVTPVLEPDEASSDPHAVARSAFVDVGGVTLPAPAPRFSRTASGSPAPAARPGDADALRQWGLADDEILAFARPGSADAT